MAVSTFELSSIAISNIVSNALFTLLMIEISTNKFGLLFWLDNVWLLFDWLFIGKGNAGLLLIFPTVFELDDRYGVYGL